MALARRRKVHVAWFRYMNVHTVVLTMAGRDDLVLLVVLSEASGVAAVEALRRRRPAGGPALRRPSWRLPASLPIARTACSLGTRPTSNHSAG